MFAYRMEFDVLQKRLEQVRPSAAFPPEDLKHMQVRLTELENQAGQNPARILELLRTAGEELETFLNGRVPQASFHAVADVHVQDREDSAEEWAAALRDMQKIHPQTNIALVSAGDMTGAGRDGEYKRFYEVFQKTAPDCGKKALFLLGNHDVRGWDPRGWSIDPRTPCAMWPRERENYLTWNRPYMPEAARETLYYARKLGEYTFLMFNTTVGIKDAMWMTPDMLLWFEEQMKACYEADPHRPVFIVAHQPLNNTHWKGNVLEGFDGLSNEPGTGPRGQKRDYSNNADEQVKKILEKYPVGIFLSGHIHNQFGMAEVQPRSYGTAVDIPSFGQPEIGISRRGTGYEVEIFPDQILFRARDFKKGQWLPEYDITMGLPLMSDVLHEAKCICGQDPGQKTLCDLVQEAEALMDRTYDQEGMPWNWMGWPEQRLFPREILEKLERIRKEMLGLLQNQTDPAEGV